MLVNSITGISLDAVLTRLLPAGIVAASNIATGACVMVATADWGPDNKVTAIGSLNDYVAAFGSYATNGGGETTGYAQAWGYFTGGKKRRISGGGSDLRMIRILGSSKAKAARTVLDNAGSPGTVGTVTALWYGAAGNNVQRQIDDGDGRLPVPVAPVLTPGSAGSLATGDVDVVLTWTNNRGETVGSAIATTHATGSSGSIAVTQPTPPAGATYWSVYAGASGSTVYRAGTAIAIGTATYTITALPANTQPTVPTTNTAATTFHLTLIPFDGSPNEVYKNLTKATAAAAVNGVSKLATWASGSSTLLPTPGVAYLSGGDSGLGAVDADYVGTAGLNPTGFELAKTVKDANFLICGKSSAAVKTQMQAVADLLWADAIIGPNDNTVVPADAITEQNFNDWAVAYAYGYQDWLNPVSGVVQSILPVGSIAGALCNGPYWVNLSQCKLTGYLGPTNPLSDADAELLSKAGIIPITDGSVCRKGSNTSTDASINQIEDFRVPVFIAKSADATVQPLIAEPQVADPTTGQSDFFDDIREALESLLRQQPKEAVQAAYVDAHFDQSLASQNKARVALVVRQTGKANQIIVDTTVGRTALAVVPTGVNLITGS
jgi:hypothetical protein